MSLLCERFVPAIEREQLTDIEQCSALLNRESPKSLASKGYAIINLQVLNIKTGYGGKVIVELSLHANVTSSKGKKEGPEFDSGDFKNGDIVQINRYSSNSERKKVQKKAQTSSKEATQEQAPSGVEGVVLKISSSSISVSLSNDQNNSAESALWDWKNNDTKVWVVKLVNDVTYRRMTQKMALLKDLPESSKSHLIQLLLEEVPFVSPPQSDLSRTLQEIQWVNDGLNVSQKKAIAFALCSNVSIIHGPPGTGKTSTLVELIRQLHRQKGKRKERILVCGPSNISVDTILERLSDVFDHKADQLTKIIRIGHPSRLLSSIYNNSLDYLVGSSDQSDILRDILREIDSNVKNIKKLRGPKLYALFQDLKHLRRDLRARSAKNYNEIILNSEIVLATLHGSSASELVNVYKTSPEPLFDTLIIDEVSQSLEPQCWIPLMTHLGIKKLIIAGDDKQLSPTIKVADGKSIKILSTTLFDRLVKAYGDQFKMFLDIQYRMSSQIQNFPSEYLYGGELKPDVSVAHQSVLDLAPVKDDNEYSLIWYDTQGGDFPESEEAEAQGGSSKFNENEVTIVAKHISSLVESGIKQQDIGVISPYNAQVSLLKSEIREAFPGIEISTVDGFQGREKEIIIVSLVRSNEQRQVGFVSNYKRLNVSITRCKRQLCVVGDMETLSSYTVDKHEPFGHFLKEWCRWMEENADVRYVTIDDVQQ